MEKYIPQKFYNKWKIICYKSFSLKYPLTNLKRNVLSEAESRQFWVELSQQHDKYFYNGIYNIMAKDVAKLKGH